MIRALGLVAVCVSLVACGTPERALDDERSIVDIDVSVSSRGAPVSGAHVGVWPLRFLVSLHERPLGALVTDTNGRARGTVKSAGVMLELVVQRRGFVEQLVFVAISQQRSRLAVEIVPEALVRGRVVDADGEPVRYVGVDARVVGRDIWPFRQYARTDTVGRFAIEGLPSGRWEIQANAPGLADLPSARAVITAPAEGVELKLGRAGALAVKVEAPPGEDVSMRPCGFSLDRLDESTGAWKRVESHSRAHNARPLDAIVGQLLPGTFRVTAGVAGVGARVSAPVEVRGGEVSMVTLELAPGRSIRGRVADTRGEPVLATVSAEPFVRVETDADGCFSAPWLPQEEFLLEVAHRESSTRRAFVRVPVTVKNLEIVLP